MFISKKSFTDSCKAMHAMGYKEGVKYGVKVGVSSAYGKSSIQGIWPPLSTEDLDRMKNEGVTITPGVEWGAPREDQAWHVVMVTTESPLTHTSHRPVTSDLSWDDAIKTCALLNQDRDQSLFGVHFIVEEF